MLPRIVFGSAYADMRLVPYLLAVAVLAIRFKDTAGPGFTRMIGLAALAFVLLRTGGTTLSFGLYDRDYDRELQALDHVPQNARLVSFVGTACVRPWKMSRYEHLPAIALVRKRAFSNDQWSMAGAQLLSTVYEPGYGYRRDPSQIVVEQPCRGEFWRTIDQSLRGFPRNAFDYVWVIDPPPYDPAAAAGLQPVWRSGTSVLYRVASRTQPPRVERPPS
jgi:hypothetical protein